MSIRTVAEDLALLAQRDPDRPAVIAGERTASYGELDRLAAALAARLRQVGVQRGDRVVLVFANSVDAVVGIQGVMRAGGALVPVNATIKRERLRFVLDHTDAAAVICDAERASVTAEAAELAGGTPVISAVEDLGESEQQSRSPLETDLAAVMYTSGSTGKPKGVMLTHRNLAFATDAIVDYLGVGAQDRILCLLPLSFGYGLTQLLTCMRVGATLVLEQGIAVPGRIVQALDEQQITGMAGVPTVFQILVSLRGLAARELPHLRFLTNAGASLPAATVAAVSETFPNAQLFLMYGLTECIRVSYLPPEQVSGRPTSSGIPMPGTDAWVDDGAGGAASPGEVGELLVRGPHVMHGYWDDPEATAERLRPGRWPWEPVLATGDLFRRDHEGYLHWVGRTDDLIKCRGEKVYPREVEEVLHEVDGVREAAVVGVPDALFGQAVHAHVALDPGAQLDERLLRRTCAEVLEEHKVPRRVFVHESLPRSARGKVERDVLISMAGKP